MILKLFLAVIFLAQCQPINSQCNFISFQGLNYALIPTGSNWNASNTACINCGSQMMIGLPSGVNATFIEGTLGVNTTAWQTAWVGNYGAAGGWCNFYTFKSGGKQFFGTNCDGNATYVICVKN